MISHEPVRFLKVDSEYAGQRLDNFLRSRYKSLPKSRLYRIIRKGEVRVNKKRVDPDYKLQTGDEVRMPPVKDIKSLPKITEIEPSLQRVLKNRIIYEDKYLLILNKPAGMAVHAGSGIRLGMVEALRIIFPKEKYIDLAHRLDRETSGCLLFVKRPSILKSLHALFRDNQIDKRYLVLVKGRWPASLRKVENPLEGKSSLTHFKIIKQYKETTLLEASLETGRNHQIRLHAMQMGYPVVGDDKYGDREFNKRMEAYGCKRLFLHAERLSFSMSIQDSEESKTISVTAPLDDDMKNCLERLTK
jgi:23S rRNA pseudouridine955/2504/2580 synthase